MHNIFTEHDPITVEGCEHCPPGTKCDVSTGACIRGMKFLFHLNLKSCFLKFKLNKKLRNDKCSFLNTLILYCFFVSMALIKFKILINFIQDIK